MAKILAGVDTLPMSSIERGAEIGKGAMGSVYKATYAGNTPVALKSLHALLSPAQYEALVGSPEYHWQVQTLVKEAAILQKVKSAHHEHILEFIGVAVDGEKPEYIVTELAVTSLDKWLESRRSITPRQLAKVAMDTMKGLRCLAALNIVHRDLKTPNILLFKCDNTTPGTAKIGDVGLARQVDTAMSRMTTCGSFFYMAPEVLTGRFSAKADIFSFGMMFAELALRYLSTKDEALNPEEWLRQATLDRQLILDEALLKLARVWPNLGDVLRKCTQTQPDDRPDAADALSLLTDACKPGAIALEPVANRPGMSARGAVGELKQKLRAAELAREAEAKRRREVTAQFHRTADELKSVRDVVKDLEKQVAAGAEELKQCKEQAQGQADLARQELDAQTTAIADLKAGLQQRDAKVQLLQDAMQQGEARAKAAVLEAENAADKLREQLGELTAEQAEAAEHHQRELIEAAARLRVAESAHGEAMAALKAQHEQALTALQAQLESDMVATKAELELTHDAEMQAMKSDKEAAIMKLEAEKCSEKAQADKVKLAMRTLRSEKGELQVELDRAQKNIVELEAAFPKPFDGAQGGATMTTAENMVASMDDVMKAAIEAGTATADGAASTGAAAGAGAAAGVAAGAPAVAGAVAGRGAEQHGSKPTEATRNAIREAHTMSVNAVAKAAIVDRHIDNGKLQQLYTFLRQYRRAEDTEIRAAIWRAIRHFSAGTANACAIRHALLRDSSSELEPAVFTCLASTTEEDALADCLATLANISMDPDDSPLDDPSLVPADEEPLGSSDEPVVSKLHAAVVDALDQLPSSESVQRNGLALFREWTTPLRDEKVRSKLIVQNRFNYVLATALQRHKDNAHIVATCLDVVANVTHIVMSMDKWVTAHEFHLKTHAALQEHPANVTVVVAGFGVLVQMLTESNDGVWTETLPPADVLSAVLDVMRGCAKVSGSEPVQSTGAALLSMLAKQSVELSSAVVSEGGLTVLADAMRQHPRSEYVQANGLTACSALLSWREPGVAAAVSTAMTTAVQSAGSSYQSDRVRKYARRVAKAMRASASSAASGTSSAGAGAGAGADPQ